MAKKEKEKVTEEFMDYVICPNCGSEIPRHIARYNGQIDTREECASCGYERDYESPLIWRALRVK